MSNEMKLVVGIDEDIDENFEVGNAVHALCRHLGFQGGVVDELARQAESMTAAEQDVLIHRCYKARSFTPFAEAQERVLNALDSIKDGITSYSYEDVTPEVVQLLHELARELEDLAAPFHQ